MHASDRAAGGGVRNAAGDAFWSYFKPINLPLKYHFSYCFVEFMAAKIECLSLWITRQFLNTELLVTWQRRRQAMSHLQMSMRSVCVLCVFCDDIDVDADRVWRLPAVDTNPPPNTPNVASAENFHANVNRLTNTSSTLPERQRKLRQ